LKRTRLGLEDFESLKVIGRGAFGEVKNSSYLSSTERPQNFKASIVFYITKIYWV
jgi:hypothetical protein